MITARLVCYHQQSRGHQKCVAAIVGPEGYKFTRAVWIGAPVRLHKVKNQYIARRSRDLPKPPVKRAARQMLKAGKSLGITKGARKFLKEVLSS